MCQINWMHQAVSAHRAAKWRTYMHTRYNRDGADAGCPVSSLICDVHQHLSVHDAQKHEQAQRQQLEGDERSLHAADCTGSVPAEVQTDVQQTEVQLVMCTLVPTVSAAASAPASGDAAMTAATVAFLMPVVFFSSGVYSSVTAADSAITVRNSGRACQRSWGTISLR